MACDGYKEKWQNYRSGLKGICLRNGWRWWSPAIDVGHSDIAFYFHRNHHRKNLSRLLLLRIHMAENLENFEFVCEHFGSFWKVLEVFNSLFNQPSFSDLCDSGIALANLIIGSQRWWSLLLYWHLTLPLTFFSFSKIFQSVKILQPECF